MFGHDAAAYEQRHQRRHQRHRQQRRCCHGEGLGVGERLEHASFLRLQCENRQERHRDDEEAEEQRRSDLDCCLDQHFAAGLVGRRTLQVLMGVFNHDDGGVDHRSDGDRDAAKAHDVGAQTEEIHAQVSDEDAKWQSDNRDQRTAYVQQEDDADQGDDDAFLRQRALESVDRAVDQLRAVVNRIDGDAFRQAWRQFGEALFYVLDDREGVLAKALNRDASDHFALAVQFGDTAPLIGRKLDASDIAEQNRHATFALDHNLLDVGD